MATLTPIASLAATMQPDSRPTTFAGGTIADPDEQALLSSFADGMKQLEEELSETEDDASKPVVANPMPWEPRWIDL